MRGIIAFLPAATALLLAVPICYAGEEEGNGGKSPFPVYNVRHFGAAGDGIKLDTKAIQSTIDAATGRGGGTVYFPPGDYLSGTVRLKSNVTLQLQAGAVLRASRSREDYIPLGPSQGMYRNHLIYAENAEDIAIRGMGTIDGSGRSFWKGAKSRWVVGEWRPGQLLQFFGCRNVLLEDVSVRNSPFHTIHPVDCNGVTIRGIAVLNGLYAEDGVNTDGITPDCCTDVRISDCYVQGGDDTIVLKCTDGTRGECRDVVVTNCIMTTTESAFKLGSIDFGKFRNISLSNCVVKDAGAGIAFMMSARGLIDGFQVSNVAMTLSNGGVPIYFWSYKQYEDQPAGTVRNIFISNVTAVADGGIFLSGAIEKPLENMALSNIRIFMRGAKDKALHAAPPYPFPIWHHRWAPYDIFCRYVNGLKLRNIQITWNKPEKPEWGSAIRCCHVKDLEIDGFDGRQSLGSGRPVIQLEDVDQAFIHNCRAPAGTGVFLRADGATRDVSLMGNDFSKAGQMFEATGGIDREELFESANRPPRPESQEIPERHPFLEEHTKAQIEELREVAGATEEVFAIAFSPDGKLLASGGADYTVKLWDVKTGRQIRSLWGHTEEVFDVAFSPDGTRLASASDDYTAKIWDTAGCKKLHTLGDHAYYVWSLAFSPDGRTLATSSYDGTIILWDVETGRRVKTLHAGTPWIYSVAFSPDGRTLASGYGGKDAPALRNEVTMIALWDVASGEPLRVLPGHPGWIWSLACSSDAKLLASAGEDGTVRLWNVATGQAIRTVPAHADDVVSVAFSPTGETLASASKDHTIKLWDVATGRALRTLSGHAAVVWSVAFSPDGTLLASGGGDGIVKLWNVARGEPLRTLPEHAADD